MADVAGADPNDCSPSGLTERIAIIKRRSETLKGRIRQLTTHLLSASAVIPYERAHVSETVTASLLKKNKDALNDVVRLIESISRKFGVPCEPDEPNYTVTDFRSQLAAYRINFNLEGLARDIVATMMPIWRSEVSGKTLLFGYETGIGLCACPAAGNVPNWYLWCACASDNEISKNVAQVLQNSKNVKKTAVSLIYSYAEQQLSPHRKKELKGSLENNYWRLDDMIRFGGFRTYCNKEGYIALNFLNIENLLDSQREEH